MTKLAWMTVLVAACSSSTTDDSVASDVPADAAVVVEEWGTCATRGYTCGSYTDNGAQYECGECAPGVNCADHQCPSEADALEPNNTALAATAEDWLRITVGIGGLSIHSSTDEDWFKLPITDDADLNDPDLRFALEGEQQDKWLFRPYEITAWFKCGTSDAGTVVECGDTDGVRNAPVLTDPTLGKGCSVSSAKAPYVKLTPSCVTTDESGVVTIRVRGDGGAPRGDKYSLAIAKD